MKRIIAVIALLSLCSCGTQTPEPTASVPQTTTEAETTATVTTTKETSGNTTITPIQKETETDPWSEFDYVCRDKYTEPLNVYDDNNLAVKCQGWVVADDFLSVKFEIENKTDSDILIKTENTSINDYDIDIYLRDSITAGKKKMIYAEAKDEDVRSANMAGKDIKQAEFRFKAYNTDYDSLFETEIITIPIEQ